MKRILTIAFVLGGLVAGSLFIVRGEEAPASTRPPACYSLQEQPLRYRICLLNRRVRLLERQAERLSLRVTNLRAVVANNNATLGCRIEQTRAELGLENNAERWCAEEPNLDPVP